MKRSGIALLLLSVSILTGTSYAGPPQNGVYQSTDLGGLVQLGRYSESFLAADGGLSPGVTFNAESWDGADLALQWRYWCGTMVAPPVLLLDNVNPGTGNGNRTYIKTFVGGSVWLSGSGPWAPAVDPDPEYVGIIDSYTIIETIQYTNWVRVSAVFNVDATAHFNDYPTTCMTIGIGNGTQVGSTDWGDTKPGDYPDLLQQSTCAPVMTLGAWWDMVTITMNISGCSVPVEESTWGAVKSLYLD